MLNALIQDLKIQEGLKIDAELEALAAKEQPTRGRKRIAALEARRETAEHALGRRK